jgi:hypothetical protein
MPAADARPSEAAIEARAFRSACCWLLMIIHSVSKRSKRWQYTCELCESRSVDS